MSNMVVRTNVFALNAHRNMKNVGLEQGRASNRLSSGFRINSAADDAAGLAISETMRAQIRGLDQASRNAQDGQAMILTTEGGLEEIGNMLQRVRELLVQAANDTNTQGQREMIEQEITQLGQEIASMQQRVEFNTNRVLAMGPTMVGSVASDMSDVRADMATLSDAFEEVNLNRSEVAIAREMLMAMPGDATRGNMNAREEETLRRALRALNMPSLDFENDALAGLRADLDTALGDVVTITPGGIGAATERDAILSMLDNRGNQLDAVVTRLNEHIDTLNIVAENLFDEIRLFVSFQGVGRDVAAEEGVWQWRSAAHDGWVNAESGVAAQSVSGWGRADILDFLNTGTANQGVDAAHGDIVTIGLWSFSADVAANGSIIWAHNTLEIPIGSVPTAADGGIELVGANGEVLGRWIREGAAGLFWQEFDDALVDTGRLTVASGAPLGFTPPDVAPNGLGGIVVITGPEGPEGQWEWTGPTGAQSPLAGGSTGNNVAFFQVGANSHQGISFDFETVSRTVTGAASVVTLAAIMVANPQDGGGIGRGLSVTPLIGQVQNSLDDVNRVRANLGAVQNRMDYTMRSLDISSENLQDSESRVRNADIAREMMRFTMANVLQQASVSMLAQANQLPNNLLQLLR